MGTTNNKVEAPKTVVEKCIVFVDVETMEKKDINAEIGKLTKGRSTDFSGTEITMLKRLVRGGKAVHDKRIDKAMKSPYSHYVDLAGDVVSISSHKGFGYCVSVLEGGIAYGILATPNATGDIVTYTIPQNSKRLPYVKRLLELAAHVC